MLLSLREVPMAEAAVHVSSIELRFSNCGGDLFCNEVKGCGPATKLRETSTAGVFLQIMRNISEQLLQRTVH